MTESPTTGDVEPSTPVDWLAARARAKPHMPWLFYRDGWHWAWRSWRRVADQVARGLDTLTEAGVSVGDRLAFRARQDPDSVAVGLTIQAAGAVAVPILDSGMSLGQPPSDCTAWISARAGEDPPRTVESGSLPCLLIPAALSALERTERRPLVLDPSSARGKLALRDHRNETSAEALLTAARLLEGRLRTPARPTTQGKSIACIAPTLENAAEQLLQAWTLVRGSAWVLEPLPEAFLPTLLWARPTLAALSGAELEPLAKALAIRKHRRHSRLRELVTEGGTTRDVTRWADLGIRAVELGENPLESLS